MPSPVPHRNTPRHTTLHRVTIAVPLLAVAAVALAKPPTDAIWIHPDLAQHRIRQIAVLPVVNVVDDGRAPAFVEERLGSGFCRDTSPFWMMPNEARRQLVRRTRKPYAQLDSLARQIWCQGWLDSVRARDVARELGVHSVLCVRINLWERREPWDIHRARAFVNLQAALVDSGGTLLWHAEGESWAHTPIEEIQALIEANAHVERGEWGVPVTSAARRWAPDFDRAVSRLLERWSRQFPVVRAL